MLYSSCLISLLGLVLLAVHGTATYVILNSCQNWQPFLLMYRYHVCSSTLGNRMHDSYYESWVETSRIERAQTLFLRIAQMCSRRVDPGYLPMIRVPIMVLFLIFIFLAFVKENFSPITPPPIIKKCSLSCFLIFLMSHL
jgi:hypothetical protein